MGFIMLMSVGILILLGITIVVVRDGIHDHNTKKVIKAILLFIVAAIVGYYGLVLMFLNSIN